MSSVFANVSNKGELKEALSIPFRELCDILIEHSGPFATNSVIGSKWRQTNDVDEFTKDGIKILRHLLVSEEPSERFAVRMARFIGIAVDNRCHDGTTTSMLLFCRLALIAIEKMDTVSDKVRYDWFQQIRDKLDICIRYIEDLKITEDMIFEECRTRGIETKPEDVRAAMAYHMAMISSKGDHDLSTKISYVIRSCPKKIFGMFRDIPLSVETEERYILKKQDYDIAFDANIGSINSYNYKNGTQYLSENAVVFYTGNQISPGTMESLFLRAFISTVPGVRADLAQFNMEQGWEAFHEGKYNLVIMSQAMDDPQLMTDITLFNMKNPDVQISYFNMQVPGKMRSNANKTVHYMAGKPLFPDVMATDPLASFIGLDDHPVKVHLIGHVVTLTGLYQKNGEVYHPYYANPEEFAPYTRFAAETEEMIEFAQANLTNPALDQAELSYLTALYRSLTVQEIYDIEVGGSAHDQYANRTVYEDAIGAALSAVNEGVVLGGYAHLARFWGFRASEDELSAKFAETFLGIVKDSLRSESDYVATLSLEGLNHRWNYIAASPSAYVSAEHDSDYIHSHNLVLNLRAFLSRREGFPFLLQAYGGYHEQLRRCRDILPKLANTTHLADMRIADDSNVR